MIIMGGSVSVHLISFGVAPILTRLYTPEDYGVFASFSAVWGIFSMAALRYEAALPVAEDEKKAINLLALCLVIVTGVSILLGIGTWLFENELLRWRSNEKLGAFLWLVPVSVLCDGLDEVFRYWIIRYKNFKVTTKAMLYQIVSQAIVQASTFKTGAFGLIIGQVFGAVMAGVILVRYLFWQSTSHLWREVSLRKMVEMAKRYWRFPVFSGSSSRLAVFAVQLPVLALTYIYGLEVVGYFTLAQRLLGVPITVIGQSVSHVYLAETSSLARDNPKALKGLFNKTLKWLSIFGVGSMILVGGISPWLFSVVFGQSWYTAGVYAMAMIPMYIVQFIMSPLSQIVFVLECQDIQLGLDMARFLLVALAFYVCYLLKLPPIWAIACYSLVVSAIYCVLILFYRRIIYKKCLLET